MLFLLFEIGRHRYAFDVGQVAEVLPRVRIRPLLHAPPGVAGLFTYHGVAVPVVDLSELTIGTPTPASRSTRIVLVNYADGRGATRLLGLLAEHVTDTMRREATDFVASGIGRDGAASSGRITTDARGVVQWIDVNSLLPAPLREVLFTQADGDR
jgi:chemotaxis-related protein WspB